MRILGRGVGGEACCCSYNLLQSHKKARPQVGVGLHRTARALIRVPRRYPTLTVARSLHKRQLDALRGAGHYPLLIAGVNALPDAHT
jgi:hypothetical protein